MLTIRTTRELGDTGLRGSLEDSDRLNLRRVMPTQGSRISSLPARKGDDETHPSPLIATLLLA